MIEFVIGFVFVLILISIYFCPTFFSFHRDMDKGERLIVFSFNFVFGWTIIGWIILLVFLKKYTTEKMYD